MNAKTCVGKMSEETFESWVCGKKSLSGSGGKKSKVRGRKRKREAEEAAENWCGAKGCSFAAILRSGRICSEILIFILKV